MSCKIRVTVLVAVLGMLVCGCGEANRNRIRFEHIALNVEDSIKVAGIPINSMQ